jgi:multidrug transporter EmrE-like cation transporter
VLINALSNYLYILGTILFTLYGQLILKWRIGKYGTLPVDFDEKIIFLLKLFLDPFILSGFFAAFLASLFWMAAMTKFELSHAYPFMAANFVLVLFFSALLFSETISILKIVGIALVFVGIIVGSQG